MNCSRLEQRLDDFVDGLLRESERAEVERHVAGCPGCRRLVDEQRALLRAAAELPRGIRPPRDLLPGIRAAVERGGRSTAAGRPTPWASPWWMGIAASLLIVSAVAIGVALKDRHGGALLADPPAGIAQPASWAEFRDAEEEYLQAARLLLASIEERGNRLSPKAKAAMRKNLLIIDQAIAEIHDALEEDPANPVNAEVLTALYQKKIDLLMRVSRLSS